MTTATRAGSEGGWYYLPIVVLAASAGYLLMEMVVRVLLVSSKSMGELLRAKHAALPVFCLIAVLVGCGAYQAGNLLGALGGLRLFVPFPAIMVLGLGTIAGLLLWIGNTEQLGRLLMIAVVIMGLLFVGAACYLVWNGVSLQGGGQRQYATIISLFGTTIVPYNFFLAAGLVKGQQLAHARAGLRDSFVVGSVVTGAIVLVGSLIPVFTNFDQLATAINAAFSGADAGAVVLGSGLFAAGLSSAITAPLAGALTARALLPGGESAKQWAHDGWAFRAVWMSVLLTGVLTGITQPDLVYVIFAAQLLNGLLLPMIAIILLLLANDKELLGKQVNGRWTNLLSLGVIAFLVYRSMGVLLKLTGLGDALRYVPLVLTTLVLSALIWVIYFRRT